MKTAVLVELALAGGQLSARRDGIAVITPNVPEGAQPMVIGGRDFRAWLTRVVFKSLGEVPGPQSMAATIRALAALAEGQPGATSARQSAGTWLVEYVRQQAELLHDGRDGYLSLGINSHGECWPLASEHLKGYLAARFFERTGQAAPRGAVAAAVDTLVGLAQERPATEVFLRVGRRDGAIFLDLGDDIWQVIEIDATGWRLAKDPPHFRRSDAMLALPVPEPGASVEELRAFVNPKDEDGWRLLVAWLVAALGPRSPYPLLVLHGEQGSGKSTVARVLQRLIDPSAGDLLAPPESLTDLVVTAKHNRLLAFDNLSSVPGWLSDALCRLATGGGLARRQLYTDDDLHVLVAQRPVVLTGLTELVTRGDLLERCLLLETAPIGEDRRWSEKELWSAFEECRPRILGALFDALSCSLRRLPEVEAQGLDLPRMADFASWVTAAESALGWEPGAFLQTYQRCLAAESDLPLEAWPASDALYKTLKKAGGAWSGTATELLTELEKHADDRLIRRRGWPSDGRRLSGALKRLAPSLRAVTIDVEFTREGHDRRRVIHLVQQHDPASAELPENGTRLPEEPEPDQLIEDAKSIFDMKER